MTFFNRQNKFDMLMIYIEYEKNFRAAARLLNFPKNALTKISNQVPSLSSRTLFDNEILFTPCFHYFFYERLSIKLRFTYKKLTPKRLFFHNQGIFNLKLLR